MKHQVDDKYWQWFTSQHLPLEPIEYSLEYVVEYSRYRVLGRALISIPDIKHSKT